MFFLFVTVVAVATSPDIASAGSKRLLSIATASTGGSWYPAGGAVGSLITKYIPNTEASAHPSAASSTFSDRAGVIFTGIGMLQE